ncbi:hypothetical protein DPMN_120960 [Dreissena polymorpha]|uniref:Uncharacterized protein n=1 Tax=Dreissena polymorpha TaxID=45954 RepID=A0A9D4GKU4_DREPO|nr:hypothetical protein DPMN_120960 [Dreissena polymorpha]
MKLDTSLQEEMGILPLYIIYSCGNSVIVLVHLPFLLVRGRPWKDEILDSHLILKSNVWFWYLNPFSTWYSLLLWAKRSEGSAKYSCNLFLERRWLRPRF